PDNNSAAPENPLAGPKATATNGPPRAGKAESEIEELSRQLEDALGGQADEAQEDDAQPASPDKDFPVASKESTGESADQAHKEMRMTVYGDKILMASNDLAALDRMEKLIQMLSASATPKTKWTVYYLKLADATETATMLGHLFPEGTVTQTTPTPTGLFGGLFATRTSENTSGLGSLSRGGALRIIPEVRSNALFISGSE